MRSGFSFGLVLLVLAAVTSAARAEEAETCTVPASLLASESSLPKVADAVKSGRPLEILVVGTRSSTITGSPDAAYPARLQVALRYKLPKATVNVSAEVVSRQTAQQAAASFAQLMAAKRPTLVIWQTGTVDAIHSTDPDDFRGAVGDGVTALRKAGADIVLMNLQYSPRTETMISGSPYIDNMRAVAQERDVPLFDRFSIMREWNEQGEFDLFSAVHGSSLAKRVHDCIGRALANFIVQAAHLGRADQN